MGKSKELSQDLRKQIVAKHEMELATDVFHNFWIFQ